MAVTIRLVDNDGLPMIVAEENGVSMVLPVISPATVRVEAGTFASVECTMPLSLPPIGEE